MRWIRKLFGGEGERGREPEGGPRRVLSPEETEKIGTEEDLLVGYEAALERNTQAARAEGRGDVEAAIRLYELSVAEEFVGAHPYERLAALHESRRRYAEALRVTEAYVRLARSGRLPRGSQRSADRKLPEFEARAERYRRMLES
ncbi:hypothetical protein GBA65_03945 [Rubrobacter marinus]|uniref:Tetratricopeptide repeat protein n=1 Tax=Rubrobacter marinus TaxID=2653852 RepID=A0A6G8PTH1_9ACTN|nr:hypothetical protein [Rubrobacter marinus]QIN77808.1 hypothetical protein GBA65_03945 [Rubrobacter marinus]